MGVFIYLVVWEAMEDRFGKRTTEIKKQIDFSLMFPPNPFFLILHYPMVLHHWHNESTLEMNVE